MPQTMPKINISFATKAASAIQRSQKGVVLLLIRDAAQGIEPMALTSVAQIPTTLSAATIAYIQNAFIGYVTAPKKVLLYNIPEGSGELETALAWAATQKFDYLCAPPDVTAAEATTIATWIKGQRENQHAIYKAVLPNCASDTEGIINVTCAEHKIGDTTYNAAQYASRYAGLIAGTPMSISGTFAPLPELTDCTRFADEDARDSAVGAGQLIVWWDGLKVKLGRAVNSLVTTTQDKGAAFQKIKIVEIIDMIQQDLRTTIQDDWIGKYANTYVNKLLLITAIRGYLSGLSMDGLVQPGWTCDIDVEAQATYLQSIGGDTSDMTEQQIREADTGSHVFIVINCKPIDAIEDVNVRINM